MDGRRLTILIACVLAMGFSLGGAVATLSQQPPKPPADLSQVRMHFTAGKLTLYAPADKVAMRPGIDKNITVIEVDTTPPIVPVQ